MNDTHETVLALLRAGIPITAVAAQLAVHRSTIYHWRATNPALRAAWEAIEWERIRTARGEVALLQSEVQRQREQRNRELLPMRQELAARARACKRP